MTDPAVKDKPSIEAIWLRNRPLVEERLALLDRVGSVAAPLSDELRAEASGVAHKLAGSLGMYGYEEGTRIARQIEALLGDVAPDVARLSALVKELRRAVFPAG